MPTKNGKERKARRRLRRQLHHTYDLEKTGMPPEEAKLVSASERAAPEPRDGELFTGPDGYIRQDIARVRKLMTMGVFSNEQKENMLRAIGSLVDADHTSSNVKIQAYRTIQAEIALFAKLLGAMPGDENVHNHLHLHGGQSAAKTLINRLERLVYDDQRPAPANPDDDQE